MFVWLQSSADSDILNRKIFVGRCTEEVTQEDLRDYFTKFGEVSVDWIGLVWERSPLPSVVIVAVAYHQTCCLFIIRYR